MNKFILFLALLSAGIAAPLEHASPGRVRYVVRTDPDWDRFTRDASLRRQEWFRSHVWRMMVYSPYWDNKLKWFPNAWVYINLYAIYQNSDDAKRHPDWILHDHQGRKLYIPWGCKDGTCPQYAANIANPDFRAQWMRAARNLKNEGYKGLWIDDVNLEFQIGDGSGKHAKPMLRTGGSEMTWDDWRRNVAEFTEQIRKNFDDTEILHNVIWFAGPKRDADPLVKRELSSADYINLERGVTDSGLRGGDGEWSLRAFFSYIDRLHKLGKGVILDNMGGKIEYATASYFLISSGVDAMGDQSLRPDHWWPGLDVDLGDPLGRREDWRGLIRRKFSKGVVLVNPPDSPPVHLTLTGDFQRADGGDAGKSLTISSADGAILLGSGAVPAKVDETIKVSESTVRQ
jgi:hypothetical protein